MNDYVMERIADLRLEAEALWLEMCVMAWRGHEYGEPVDFRSILRGHERLSSPDTIRLVKRAAWRCNDPSEKRALDYLLSFLVDLYVGHRTAPHRDRLMNAQLRARVRLDGRSVSYRTLSSLMANEPDRARRRRIHSLEIGVIRRLNPQYAELWRLEHAVPREIGLSYTRLSEVRRHVKMRDLSVLARQLLDRTEKTYLWLLEEQSRALLDCSADRVSRADVPRLGRNETVEHRFPAEQLLATAERTAKGLGFDLQRMDNLRIFAEDRPDKAPRAICCPLKVPGDVRLSVRPVGGVRDYETLLHELGHGLHFAMTRSNRFEFQHRGGDAVSETYAFLLQHLVDNRHWLAGRVRMSEGEIAPFLRFRAFVRLFAIRRYAAKILYEIHFHSGRKKPRDAYRRLLSRAYGFALTREDTATYLSDIDPTFYAADYFRAWLLEAVLANKLEERFGPRWFQRKTAGEFLARLWASGSQMTGDELLARLGARRHTITPWLNRVRALLRG